jgi:[ribosomal protein S5]-alanine N-acetyltransferase
MIIHCSGFSLRSWREGDQPSLVRNADDREIWRNLRDRFPSPYTDAAADQWVGFASSRDPLTDLAIDVDGEAVGGIGIMLQEDVERCSAEIGYWLGRHYHGAGVMTQALRAMTGYAFTTFRLTRIYAVPFDFNAASIRVLEKAGYSREGVLRRSAVKEGRVVNQILFGVTDLEWQGA